jgi:hypothetical protein
MATQKVRPDPGILERQDRRSRRWSTARTVGMYGLVAVVIFVVTAAAVAVLKSEPSPDEMTLARPSATEPAVTDHLTGPTDSPSEVPGRPNALRPDGSEPAAPEHGKHGKLVMSDTTGGGAYGPSYAVYVFADGRVIWRQRGGGPSVSTGWLVRRLTPEAIDLPEPYDTPDIGTSNGQLSQPQLHLDPLGLPVGAWGDPTSKPYRGRYAVCPRASVSAIWRLFPTRARKLLGGSEEGYIHGCLVVTTEDARRLDEILSWTDGYERDTFLGQRKYRIHSGSVTASFAVIPVLPNATFEVWS